MHSHNAFKGKNLSKHLMHLETDYNKSKKLLYFDTAQYNSLLKEITVNLRFVYLYFVVK